MKRDENKNENNVSVNVDVEVGCVSEKVRRAYVAPEMTVYDVEVEDGYALSAGSVEIGGDAPSGCGTEIVSEMAGPSRDFIYF